MVEGYFIIKNIKLVGRGERLNYKLCQCYFRERACAVGFRLDIVFLWPETIWNPATKYGEAIYVNLSFPLAHFSLFVSVSASQQSALKGNGLRIENITRLPDEIAREEASVGILSNSRQSQQVVVLKNHTLTH
jgi:hypothetical protein